MQFTVAERIAVTLVPIIAIAVYSVLVAATRRRLNAVSATRRAGPSERLGGRVVDVSEEARIRILCERIGLGCVAIGVLGVAFMATAPSGRGQSVTVYVWAALVALGPGVGPKVAYRLLRPGSELPAHYRSEVRASARSPFRDVTGRADLAKMRTAQLLQPVGVGALLMGAAMLPTIGNPHSSLAWRFGGPLAAAAVGFPLYRLSATMRSSVIANSKTFTPHEFLQLPLEQLGAMLRSFQDDGSRLATRTSVRLSELEVFSLATRAERFERVLAWAVAPYVPTFALSDPNRLDGQDVGMGRITLAETEDWHPLATQLIERTTLLLVLVGTSASLTWEVENIARHDRLRRTLFVVPPSANDLGARLAAVAHALGLADPRVDDGEPIIGFTVDDAGFSWYCSSVIDEQSYAVMVQRYAEHRGTRAATPTG